LRKSTHQIASGFYFIIWRLSQSNRREEKTLLQFQHHDAGGRGKGRHGQRTQRAHWTRFREGGQGRGGVREEGKKGEKWPLAILCVVCVGVVGVGFAPEGQTSTSGQEAREGGKGTGEGGGPWIGKRQQSRDSQQKKKRKERLGLTKRLGSKIRKVKPY